MAIHSQLWRVCRPSSFASGKIILEKWEGWTQETDKPDCSCGCKWFHVLDGKTGADWGVCFNKDSPRAGLLTFEHMGCHHFKAKR